MIVNKGTFSLLVLAAAAVSSVQAKSQWDRGYDSIIGRKQATSTVDKKKHKAPRQSAKAAATPPPPPPKVLVATKKVNKKQAVEVGQDDMMNDLVKAAIGVGAAALGAKVVQSAVDSRALVETTAKPVLRNNNNKNLQKKNRKASASSSEGATIPNEIFNLVKAIVGVGVLSLPAGVATFGDSPSAFIPAAILISVIGMLSAYGFALIGKVCAYTGAKSYRDAWSKTVGPGTSWIPAWSTTCKTFLACLAFSMVLADTFSSLFSSERSSTLLGVTGVILLPLCLLKDLKSLAPFSLLGIMGMAYTAIAMTIRWLDGTYAMGGGTETSPSGVLVAQVARHLKPKFGDKGMASVFTPNSLILVCMLSTAYMAHFNAPKFYLELKDNTLPRFNKVVSASFGISILLMGFITMVGFLTFGRACDGLVLNNYASTDVLMGGSRIAVAISLVFSYPLAFTGCRDGVLDLINVPMADRTDGKLNSTTMILLAVITVLAITLRDVSFVLAFGGATLGNALTYVYPALMYRAVVKQQGRDETFGVNVAMASAALGIVMGVVGATMAIKSIME